MANKFTIGDSVLCTIEKDGEVITKRGTIKGADANTVVLDFGFEIGTQYGLKAYDDVENHHGISRDTWGRIAKAPLIVDRVANGKVYCHGYGGNWYFSTDAFCEYVPVYNGKVVCVNNAGQTHRYTIGKVYTFKDGYMENDHDTQPKSRPIKDFADWQGFSDAKWVELVED